MLNLMTLIVAVRDSSMTAKIPGTGVARCWDFCQHSPDCKSFSVNLFQERCKLYSRYELLSRFSSAKLLRHDKVIAIPTVTD